MANVLEELNAAVQALPEFYQPIFGHEVTGAKPARICTDRLADIKKVYDALSNDLQRPLRVLDLGCNLGFFSLHAAKWGGVVTGIDYDPRNIRVCQILASEHPDYKIRFGVAKVEEFLPTIQAGEYDLVFCFNVLHWVTPKFGFPFVQNLLKDLAEKIPTGLFELPMKSEFPNNNLPDNYRDFFQGYPFIRAVAYNIWGDIRQVQRAFLFVSKSYVYLDTLGLLKIDKFEYSTIVPKLITYYHCGDKFVKCCYIVDQFINDKILREIEFLRKLGGQNGLPQLFEAIGEKDEAGVRYFIAREKLPGTSLLKKIEQGEDFDRRSVIKQILQWTIFWEKNGYYQGDLHLGNYLLNDDGKLLPIDYEFMFEIPRSIHWPYNYKMAFFDLLNSVFETTTENLVAGPNNELRGGRSCGKLLTEFHKHVTDAQFEQILKLKDDEKFFEKLYEILFPPQEKISQHTMAEIEILEIENYLDKLGMQVGIHSQLLQQLFTITQEQQARIEELEKIVKGGDKA